LIRHGTRRELPKSTNKTGWPTRLERGGQPVVIVVSQSRCAAMRRIDFD